MQNLTASNLNSFNSLFAMGAVEIACSKTQVSKEIQHEMVKDLANALVKVDEEVKRSNPRIPSVEELGGRLTKLKFFSKPQEIAKHYMSAKKANNISFALLITAICVAFFALLIWPVSLAVTAATLLIFAIFMIAYLSLLSTAAIQKEESSKEIEKVADLISDYKRFLQMTAYRYGRSVESIIAEEIRRHPALQQGMNQIQSMARQNR
jgi:hypothetical protein